MPITIQHKKEALGQAYLRAIIASAGFNLGKSDFDYCFDGTIKDVADRGGRYYETDFGLNYQLKSSSNVNFEADYLVYDLESKNYNDLVIETTMLPNILVLFVLPNNEPDWLDVRQTRMIIKKCAWWCSLEGLPPTGNEATRRVRIPIHQVFSPEALTELMDKVKGGQKL